MSQYRVHATAIRSPEALVEALVDRARTFARQQCRSEAEAEAALRAAVELHVGAPVALQRTYSGQATAALDAPPVELALRQPHCQALLGCAQWEDIGFSLAADGTYQAHMSSHDYWWLDGGEARFLQVAQAHEALRAAQLAGYTVSLTEANGLLQLVCESY